MGDGPAVSPFPADEDGIGISGRLLPYRERRPRVAADAFVAAGAILIGDVEIGRGSSVWFNCVLRGDVNRIRIGRGTSIQDMTMIHCSGLGASWPTLVGDEVTVGHMATIHGCVIEDRCLIGMRAIVMDGAVVERGAIVAAGALVPPGGRVPAGEVWAGMPARKLRDVAEADEVGIETLARSYAALSREYVATRASAGLTVAAASGASLRRPPS